MSNVELAAQDRSRKRVAGYSEIQWLGASVDVCIEVSVEIYLDVAGGHLFRKRNITAGGNLRII